MKRKIFLTALSVMILLNIFGNVSEIESTGADPEKVNLAANYGSIPLHFEPNVGQANSQIKFLTHGSGYSLFLTADEAVLALQKAEPGSQNSKSDVLRMKIAGANASAETTAENLLEGKTNYIRGSDPGKWKTDIANFERVRYSNIYRGVDVVYYGSGKQLEYDFVVSPGVAPSTIALEFKGAEKIKIDDQGELVLLTKGGEIRQHRPNVYQEVGGERRMIDGRYVATGKSRIGFAVAEYDHNLPLVIDPVLVYSTYLGGNSNDEGDAIAVDTQGNAYITGFTSSTDFPTRNPFQAAKAGGANITDVFVTKLNATGNALVYATYLGGSSTDFANGIAVDTQGNAYITGGTNSINFPTMNPFQAALDSGGHAFVTKLNATGDALVYSTYLRATANPDPRGDFGSETGYGIAVDTQGNAYVTGSTTSSNFPTVNPFQAIRGGASTDRSQDAFVTKFNAAGNALVYSTYLGGSNPGGTGTGVDAGYGISVDAQGNAYVTGVTKSTNFPTQNPFQSTLSGGNQGQDAFVTKLSSTGNSLVYSTYLGGSDLEDGYGIGVDPQGNAYVAGLTDSLNFPTSNPFQPTKGGGAFATDVFVTKFTATGNALAYSTYLGGTEIEEGYGIAVDTQGNAFIVGKTSSPNFPTRNPLQAALNGTTTDAFVTKLTTTGGAVYSTYFGGSNNDVGRGIAVDGAGNAYITGSATSTNFPTLNPFQATHGVDFTSKDAFVSKISDGTIPTPTPTPTPPALATVDGRALTSDGRGLRNATVSITDSQGVSLTATTSSFGFFSFANVTTGQTYTFRVSSRLFRFAPQTVQINANLTLPDFVGLE